MGNNRLIFIDSNLILPTPDNFLLKTLKKLDLSKIALFLFSANSKYNDQIKKYRDFLANYLSTQVTIKPFLTSGKDSIILMNWQIPISNIVSKHSKIIYIDPSSTSVDIELKLLDLLLSCSKELINWILLDYTYLAEEKSYLLLSKLREASYRLFFCSETLKEKVPNFFERQVHYNQQEMLSSYKNILQDLIAENDENNGDLVISHNGILLYQPALNDMAVEFQSYVEKKYPNKNIILLTKSSVLLSALELLVQDNLLTINLTPPPRRNKKVENSVEPRVLKSPLVYELQNGIGTAAFKESELLKKDPGKNLTISFSVKNNEKDLEVSVTPYLILAGVVLPIVMASISILVIHFGLFNLPFFLTSLGTVYSSMLLGGLVGLVLDILMATVYLGHYMATAYKTLPIQCELVSGKIGKVSNLNSAEIVPDKIETLFKESSENKTKNESSIDNFPATTLKI